MWSYVETCTGWIPDGMREAPILPRYIIHTSSFCYHSMKRIVTWGTTWTRLPLNWTGNRETAFFLSSSSIHHTAVIGFPTPSGLNLKLYSSRLYLFTVSETVNGCCLEKNYFWLAAALVSLVFLDVCSSILSLFCMSICFCKICWNRSVSIVL